MNNKVLIPILALLILFFIGSVYVFIKDIRVGNEQISCTAEAKICPDGSAVGRTGPNCEFEDCPIARNLSFGEQILLNIDEKVTFVDGLEITLLAINDSRCKDGVVCIWAGELSPVIKITGGNFTQTEKEIILGTETRFSLFDNGYSIMLVSATEAQAVIIVEDSPVLFLENFSYTIEGKKVSLIDGYSEVDIPNSGSKVITTYFGNEAYGDLNGDNQEDTAFYLTQETGGSGIFYYFVGALKTTAGYQLTNTVLIGDRIAPQSTEIKNGAVIVNYADRNLGEPLTEEPSVNVSKYFKVIKGKLTEQKNPVVSSCYIGGCSSEICSDKKDMVSTCIYKEEFACYENAECKRQANDKCGWTQTDELLSCLTSNK